MLPSPNLLWEKQDSHGLNAAKACRKVHTATRQPFQNGQHPEQWCHRIHGLWHRECNLEPSRGLSPKMMLTCRSSASMATKSSGCRWRTAAKGTYRCRGVRPLQSRVQLARMRGRSLSATRDRRAGHPSTSPIPLNDIIQGWPPICAACIPMYIGLIACSCLPIGWQERCKTPDELGCSQQTLIHCSRSAQALSRGSCRKMEQVQT